MKTYWNLPQNGGQTAAKSLKSAWNQLECPESVLKCGENGGQTVLNAFKVAGKCKVHWDCTRICRRSACNRGEHLLEFASKRWSNCCKTHESCLKSAGMSWKRDKMSQKRWVNLSGYIQSCWQVQNPLGFYPKMLKKRLHQRWKPTGICFKTDVKLLYNPWNLPGISWNVMKAWQNVAKTLGKPLWMH